MFQNLTRTASALALLAGLAPAALAQDTVLVGDYAGSAIIKFAYPSGTALSHFVGNGMTALSTTGGMTFGPDNNLYIASINGNAVIRVNGVTGVPINGGTFVTAGAGGLSSARDVAFGPDGKLYVSSYNNDSVNQYDPINGNFIQTFIAVGSGGLDGPNGITFYNGDLYVCSYLNHKVIRYNGTTGAYVSDFYPGSQSGLVNPREIIFDSAGRSYVSSGSNAIIVKDPGTGFSVLTSFATNNQINNPQFMTLTSAGQLLVCCFGNGTVQKVDRLTGAGLGTLVLNGAGGLSNCISVLYAPGVNPCYANCDNSTNNPVLNVNDFQCFLNKFAVGCT